MNINDESVALATTSIMLRERCSGSVCIIDDDPAVRDGIADLCRLQGYDVDAYVDVVTFLDADPPSVAACLLVDAVLPGMSGIALLELMGREGRGLTSIVITGRGDVRSAVSAMRAGAIDYVLKPVDAERLLDLVAEAVGRSLAIVARNGVDAAVVRRMGALTPRQRQIMALVVAGHPSKNIAADLGISRRTVENHRATIMERTGSGSVPALARFALQAAGRSGDSDPMRSGAHGVDRR